MLLNVVVLSPDRNLAHRHLFTKPCFQLVATLETSGVGVELGPARERTGARLGHLES